MPQGAPVAVPSGMAVSFHEMLWDDSGQGPVYRLRFVAPAIGDGGALDYDALSADMDALCNGVAVPATDGVAPTPARIVISLMAAPTVFGQPSPDTRQIFEAYTLRDGVCIWEAF
ncbi:acetolactate synthase [Salipiger aestuarii]|nr:acetolactate synthase [Salipiger aestuarii]KAA8610569.1 acetolactate synthase [Salipiger aestuarii]KAB2541318.1 acetolactate synthase [Salipiger aestuarii]